MQLNDMLRRCPLIAILRGITAEEVISIAETLIDSGFVCLEIPLNTADSLVSIELLHKRFAEQILIGAGTVVYPQQVVSAAQAGAKIILTPHSDPEIIATAKEIGLNCIAGFSTPTEAFSALNAGADALKIFPAPIPATLKSIKTVLPMDIPIIAVGGITPESMVHYLHAGAVGFGIGKHLYQAGDPPQLVKQNAKVFYDSIRALS